MNSKQLPTLAEFRVKRNRFQAERRAIMLPILKAEQASIAAELTALRWKHNQASKRDKELIENNMVPLQWRSQYLFGQISIIEREQS